MASYPIVFTVDGDLEVEDDASYWYICNAPYGLTLLDVDLAVKTPCTGAIIMIDIEKSTDAEDWTSIFYEGPGLISGFLHGAHDGPEDSPYLIDSDGPFTSSMEGLAIQRDPDGATGTITSVISATTLQASFGDWDTSTNDQYLIAVAGGILPGEYIGVGGILDDVEIEEGTLLRLDVEQCGSSTPGADLTVSLRVRQ